MIVALLALPVLCACGWLAFLALCAREVAPPAPEAPRRKFDLIVPAHDEEAGVGATVQSLLALDWPKELFRVLVVADNCSDQTAQAAAEAGAVVIERSDAERRGKGYALALAFERSRSDGFAEAVVVVDADTLVSRGLLASFAARLAAGEQALQADYGVRNPEASWRTRLLRIAFALFHGVRSLARERLRLSCGLRGNGMCFTHALLGRIPYAAFSLVEDVEYGIALGEAGVRVAYVAEAQVLGEMTATSAAARSQRLRWEAGRKKLARTAGPRLLLRAVKKRDSMLFDLALDLLIPPLAVLCTATALGLIAAALVHSVAALALWLACAACLFAYVGRGWMLSGTGAAGLLDLIRAPAYILWKAGLWARGSAPAGWVRTARDGKAR